jgi:hypothetical protein
VFPVSACGNRKQAGYDGWVDQAAEDLWDAFLASLRALGLAAELDPQSGHGRIEEVGVRVRVKAVPVTADVAAFAAEDGSGAYKVVVGRRMSNATRAALAEHDMGFFDARGHLRLWRRPLLVDTDVPALWQAAPGKPRDFTSPSLLDVALAALDGVVADGVRATAAVLGRSPGTISKRLAVLRAAHLVDEHRAPAVPDLFDAVLEVWHPVRLPLKDRPTASDAAGWVLADTWAADAWGAPVITTEDAPRDFYVPDAASARRARALLGDADFGAHGSTVAVAPAPFVCRRHFDRGVGFDAPSPVVAALDLASDPARGREILEEWSQQLPPGVRRVW